MELNEYRAAGGIVLDQAGRALVIERVVIRDGAPALENRLPKGHVEPGETDEQAAVREVCEETGYCGLSVIADLGKLTTEFDWPGRDIHVRRHEHYFLMRLADPVAGQPRCDGQNSEEALFRPLWTADLAEAERKLTFESERTFVRRARGLADSLIR